MNERMNELSYISTASTRYTLRHSVFLSYDVFLLHHFHIIFVYDASSGTMFYIPCTPSEFMILSRLLEVPAGETVPFEHLSPHASSQSTRDFMGPLQRHICRLKKKLPPLWEIVCELGIGYQLQVLSSKVQRRPRRISALSPLSHKRGEAPR